jgi:hypothetical protein
MASGICLGGKPFLWRAYLIFLVSEEFGLSLFRFLILPHTSIPALLHLSQRSVQNASQILMGYRAALRQRQSSNDTTTTLKENQNELAWNVSVVNGHRSSARHGKKSASSSQ